MKILLSNDDGYQAPGIVALYEAIRDLGDVEVVAPEHNNSAKSNALTLHQPLYVTEAAVKQHLQNLYDKFSIPTEGDRRVRLANEALRRGAVTIAQLRGSGS